MLRIVQFTGWFNKHRMSLGVLLYCFVVALLASAAALISMELPFTGFRHVVDGTLKAFKI